MKNPPTLTAIALILSIGMLGAAEPEPIPDDLAGVSHIHIEIVGPDSGTWILGYDFDLPADAGTYRAVWHQWRGGDFVHGLREDLPRSERLDQVARHVADWLRAKGRQRDLRDLPPEPDFYYATLSYTMEIPLEPPPDEVGMPPETGFLTWTFYLELPRRGLPRHVEQFQQLIEELAPLQR